MPTTAYPFSIRGASHTLVAKYFNAEEALASNRTTEDIAKGVFTESEVEQTINRLKVFWTLFMSLEFKTFGVLDNGIISYDVIFDRRKNGDGEANNGQIILDTTKLNNGNSDGFNQLLIHELFHACQYASVAGTPFGHAFNEGTANIAAFLMDLGVRANVGISSYTEYLDNPGATMWDRPTPGKVNDDSSSPTLWWLYFCDQLGTTTFNIGGKMDCLVRLLAKEWPEPNAWNSVQAVFAKGNFLGNQDTQIMLRNPDSGDLGLVSANKSYGGNGTTHTIIAVNSRWGIFPNTGGAGWKCRKLDGVYAKGDLLGNGRTQLILKGRSPVYIGVVGFKASDGSPRQPAEPETYFVRLNGNAWSAGGWQFQSNDAVKAVGNFVSQEKQHFIIQNENPISLGVLGLVSAGQPETIVQIAQGDSFGTSGWRLQPGDKVVGHGDFLGNGRDQFILSSSSPTALGIVGLSSTGALETYAILKSTDNDRFGTGWRIRNRDRIVATGHIVSNDRSHMVIQSMNPNNLGIVGFSSSGQTQTVHVISEGQALGTDWNWSSTDRFLGVGDFVGENKQQLAVISWDQLKGPFAPLRLALINFESDGSVVSHDYADKDRGNVFDENSEFKILGIGDFAGMGRDQLLTTHSTGSSSYLRNISYESLDASDIGHWRHQFAIGTAAQFFSSHRHLNEFIKSETDDRRSFEIFWRDFTITNLTKKMAGAPTALKYSFELDSKAVAINATLNVGDRTVPIEVKRWSAMYFKFPTSSSARMLKIQAGQEGIDRYLYWTIVISDSANAFKEVIHFNNPQIYHVCNLAPRDRVHLVVSCTYAAATIWVENSI